MEILTESPQSVNLNGENDNCIRDEKVQLQQAHIAELVKKKNCIPYTSLEASK